MILFLAGTSDARALALELKKEKFPILTTVVTENAAYEMKNAGLDVHMGRLTDKDIYSFIKGYDIQSVVDASHPFAEEASKNAMQGAELANVPYIRYERVSQQFNEDHIVMVNSYEEAAQVAASKKGVIMLTTGSKTLQVFSEKLLDLPEVRLVARMLPRKDNMKKCEQLGFPQKNIVAIQGPFTKEFNKALYKQYGVTVMVTKESGKAGSVDEKLEAAKELGIDTIMIKRPQINYRTVYHQFSDIVKHLKDLSNEGEEK
ncbi:precorrin-6A/cobalt-precorrin-6A reductase [Thalassobacillus cyri]|uniref:Precorrin-6A/cobalt-precorrin-6A reductase n=1 Tax=Thalassobacillus cyri TaxID=571932 RepID=A0A1H4GVU1_9BACI|nr:precorrin-6A reductase [Thalassobacillus cyri]SEB13677.1 precorrin-6A/cobalt-precorrin-6A reductase [Thalassobacillus cyri]